MASTDPHKPDTTRPRRKWRRRGVVLVLAIVVFGSAYTARGALLPPVARFLNVGELPARVDYVMVLGGDAGCRPFLAAAMYRHRLAKAVLVADSRPAPENLDGFLPEEDEIIRRVLVHEGVPAESIVKIGVECNSTRDEAASLARFLQASPKTSAAVVTTCYHTCRTRRVFQRELGPLSRNVSFIGIPTEAFSDDNWWKSRSGFLTYVDEYLKSAWYWIRY